MMTWEHGGGARAGGGARGDGGEEGGARGRRRGGGGQEGGPTCRRTLRKRNASKGRGHQRGIGPFSLCVFCVFLILTHRKIKAVIRGEAVVRRVANDLLVKLRK